MLHQLPLRVGTVTALVALAATWALPVGAAQVAEGPVDTTAVVADSSDLVSVGRAAQALFERRRLRHLPVAFSPGGGSGCDEHVGRFCTWYSEGEWYPQAEKDEIVEMRVELIEQLDELQRQLPGEPWLLGQRVWYRSEGGDREGALRTAQACGTAERWWCRALVGFALHGLGRYVQAEAAFAEALDLMDAEQAEEWRLPRRAVDSDARSILDDVRQAPPDSSEAVLDRLWMLADPLYLVAGNDRLTAHYARWAVSTLREQARNPFQIRWGRDLEELTIRHGWELGWERSPRYDYSALDHVIGHKHPEGRDYMPPGDVLSDPATATVDDLVADRRRPRSLHAPDYAPVLLPMDGQIAVFPRGHETVFVSTHFLPDDTTYHAAHEHDLPWLEAGSQVGMPDRIGLFVAPLDKGVVRGRTASHRSRGALMLKVPTGSYVVSAEAWSPELRRAGRRRLGQPARAAPEDIATLSDLLLLRPMTAEPAVLEQTLEAALPRARILPGQTLAIAWEVAGLGFRPETLQYSLSVDRVGVNVFRRLGEFLRITDRPQPLALFWEEPGPERPEPAFRYLDLDLPPLDEGEYEIRLVLHTVGRTDAVTAKRFEVQARR